MLDINFKTYSNVTATTLPTGRTYHTPDGNYPSITTILGKTANQQWLINWRNKVGEEEANRISKYATDRGELVHSYLERYWNGEDVMPEVESDNSYLDVSGMTKRLIKATNKNITNIFAQEIPVWNKELGYAGRVDAVGEWRNELAIIDYKTSKKRKYISGIKDYFLQVAAYAEATNLLYGTNINKLVILVTVENQNVQAFYGDRLRYLPELKYRLRLFKSTYGEK